MKKLVYESLNELNFQRKMDNPLSTLGIGRRKMIEDWLDEKEIKNYVIKDDLTIDVKGDVNLNNRDLTKFPEFIRFNKVSGNFWCSKNSLVSLEGCPSSVGGSFGCHTNNLVSLEGCPSSVSGDFWCARNNLISLKGCPTSVGGSFRCSNNPGKFTEEDVKKHCDVHRIYLI
jgi:hypothetical protein